MGDSQVLYFSILFNHRQVLRCFAAGGVEDHGLSIGVINVIRRVEPFDASKNIEIIESSKIAVIVDIIRVVNCVYGLGTYQLSVEVNEE